MSSALLPGKVILAEFNEITTTILDPLIARGKLPHFERIRREGAWAEPESIDLPPHLDPWITWVTVHTGAPRSVHGATVLEQEEGTIRAPRSWQYAVEAGKSVGVFGSIAAYPPRPVPGFIIPGPFAPASAAYPDYLWPVHDFNRRYTGIHAGNQGAEGLAELAQRGLDLLRLGIQPATAAAIAAQLARERAAPHARWRRAALQPLINFDVFQMLYLRYRPDYATWHTNHAAHYMHHYWRSMDDTAFLVRASPEEKRRYGGAVELGYAVCDELLGRFMRLAGEDTTLVVASSMGQQPYVDESYREGRLVVRVKDIQVLLRILGAEGVAEAVPAMVPEWHLNIADPAQRARVKGLLARAYRTGTPGRGAFGLEETGRALTIGPKGLPRRGEIRYFFPGAPGARAEGHPLEEIFAIDAPTPKQGMHHPRGVLGLWGRRIRAGVEIPRATNLDIAPTLLTLLGVPVPQIMQGRVLREAWDERQPAAARPTMVA